jgi:hypothetical protein
LPVLKLEALQVKATAVNMEGVQPPLSESASKNALHTDQNLYFLPLFPDEKLHQHPQLLVIKSLLHLLC